MIEVYPEDAERAEAALVDWERPQAERVRETERRVAGVLAASLVLPALWLISAFLEIEGTPHPTPFLVGALWFACLIAVGQLESRRRASESAGLTDRGDS